MSSCSLQSIFIICIQIYQSLSLVKSFYKSIKKCRECGNHLSWLVEKRGMIGPWKMETPGFKKYVRAQQIGLYIHFRQKSKSNPEDEIRRKRRIVQGPNVQEGTGYKQNHAVKKCCRQEATDLKVQPVILLLQIQDGNSGCDKLQEHLEW